MKKLLTLLLLGSCMSLSATNVSASHRQEDVVLIPDPPNVVKQFEIVQMTYMVDAGSALVTMPEITVLQNTVVDDCVVVPAHGNVVAARYLNLALKPSTPPPLSMLFGNRWQSAERLRLSNSPLKNQKTTVNPLLTYRC